MYSLFEICSVINIKQKSEGILNHTKPPRASLLWPKVVSFMYISLFCIGRSPIFVLHSQHITNSKTSGKALMRWTHCRTSSPGVLLFLVSWKLMWDLLTLTVKCWLKQDECQLEIKDKREKQSHAGRAQRAKIVLDFLIFYFCIWTHTISSWDCSENKSASYSYYRVWSAFISTR